MADTVRPDFSSVYVLDAHFQYKDGVVDVFNSPAGRAVISECSPNKLRSPVFKINKRSSNPDVTKFLLSQENCNGNMYPKTKYDDKVIVYEEDEIKQNCVRSQANFSCWQSEIGSNLLEDRLSDDLPKKATTDDSLNNNGLTRRLVTFKNTDEEEAEKLATLADLEEDIRINEKILRLKNHYERGFVADEKCDILKRMLTGFLSGWIFAKSSSRSGSKWRKRKSSDDLYREASMALGIPCEMTDNCRCLDCQCNYFDCGDSDSDESETSINLNECDVEEWPCPENVNESPSEKTFDVFHYEDEVSQKKTEMASPSPDAILEISADATAKEADADAIPASVNSPICDHTVIVVEETETVAAITTTTAAAAICQNGAGGQYVPAFEMAAGAPLLFDHLLNTPLSCTLQ